eukprot:COSAG02_NODE_37428_length_442_cov_0.755102_2_plen_45_part_00
MAEVVGLAAAVVAFIAEDEEAKLRYAFVSCSLLVVRFSRGQASR